MADIDVSTMTGADLTNFRKAMLRAGFEGLLGKVIAVDLNTAGATPIPLNRDGRKVVVTKIVGTNQSTGFVANAVATRANTAADGSGTTISAFPSFDGGGSEAIAECIVPNAAGSATAGLGVDQDEIYLLVETPEGSAATCDFYVYGFYADPA